MRRIELLGTAAALCVTQLALVGPTRSATLRVPADYATIQNGIDAAAFGDTVLVAPGVYSDFEHRTPPGGFEETSCMFLADGVTVRSEGGSAVTVIELADMVGLQQAGITAENLASTDTRVEGFAIDGPEALGAFVYLCGNVTFKDCLWDDFDGGPTSGGAVIVTGNAAFIDCEFVNCRAHAAGALWHTDGYLEMVDCVVRECGNVGVYVSQGGGLLTSATITGCEFRNNWSDGGGAGAMVVAAALAQTTIRDCLFIGNTNLTGTGCGGLSVGTGPKTIEDCVFIGNVSRIRGAALSGGTSAYPFIVRRNTFVDNHTLNTSVFYATVYVNPCNFENNVIVGSRNSVGVAVAGGSVMRSQACNVFWDNELGSGVTLSATDRVVDPDFCDRVAVDLTLRLGSPCLPEDPLGCGQIGALGLGCGTVSLEPQSWGRIKELYRLPEVIR